MLGRFVARSLHHCFIVWRSADLAGAHDYDPMGGDDIREFVRAYYMITDPALRKYIFDLVKAIAARTAGPPR